MTAPTPAGFHPQPLDRRTGAAAAQHTLLAVIVASVAIATSGFVSVELVKRDSPILGGALFLVITWIALLASAHVMAVSR